MDDFPIPYDVTLESGVSFAIDFIDIQPATSNVGVNLTGAIARIVFKHRGNVMLDRNSRDHSDGILIFTPALGKVSIRLPSNITAAWEGTFEVGCDIIWTAASSFPLVRGKWQFARTFASALSFL